MKHKKRYEKKINDKNIYGNKTYNIEKHTAKTNK